MRTMRFFRFFRHLTPAIIRKMIVRSGRQRLPSLAAEIAFNSVLALFPAIVALLTIIGLVGEPQRAFQALSEQLVRYAPVEVLEIISRFLAELEAGSNQRLLSISFIAAIWLASGVVSSMMSALDQIHRVPPRQIRPFWKAKLVSLWLTFGTLFLLVAASIIVFVSDLIFRLVVTQGGQLVETIANQPNLIEPKILYIWSRLTTPIALGLVAIAFAFIYRFGPSRRIKSIPILPGAILATLFWAILSGIFRIYVSNFGNYNRVYGAVGAIIVMLIWLQLGALTMLIGAQLNVTVGEAMQKSNFRKTKRPLPDIAQDSQQDGSENQDPNNPSRNKP